MARSFAELRATVEAFGRVLESYLPVSTPEKSDSRRRRKAKAKTAGGAPTRRSRSRARRRAA